MAGRALAGVRHGTMKLRITLLSTLLLLSSCAGTQWRDPETYLRLGQSALECSGDLMDGASDAEAIAATVCLLGVGLGKLESATAKPPAVTPERAQAVAEKMVPCAQATEAYLADAENKALRIQLEHAAAELDRVKRDLEGEKADSE